MTCLKCRLVTLVWELSFKFGKHCRNYKMICSKRGSAVTHILSQVRGPKAFCKNNQGNQVLQWPSQRNSIECADKLKKNWMENIIKDKQEGSCSRASWVCFQLLLVLLKGHITSVVIIIQLTRFRFKCSEITTANFYCKYSGLFKSISWQVVTAGKCWCSNSYEHNWSLEMHRAELSAFFYSNSELFL